MSTVPTIRTGKVQFYENHVSPWATNAVAIGLTVADVTALGVDTGAARAAYNEMLAARSASKAATQNFYNMVAAMHSAPGRGSDMLDAIRNYAQTTGDPDVYTLAEVPPPADPGTVPPPGTPDSFRVSLLQDRAIELSWKCDNPAGAAGTVYEIRRAVDGGPMTLIDTAGERKFVDATLPANPGPVTYRVTAIRSTLKGNPASYTVYFGMTAGRAA